ncbi:MAG: class I SAM-dependent methyltransferase [Bacteroidetes bacterium]|jgi:precorrin-6B methylase 2|nr:class I SAM-dependent methyltransferase [Bacteroidota bacterium]
MISPEIKAHIKNIKNNSLLYDEKNFDARTDAIDFLEFHILDQIEALRSVEPDQNKLTELQHQANKLKSQLEEIDNELFQKLQKEIRQKKYSGRGFDAMVRKHVNFENCSGDEEGYDNLDIFINRLLSVEGMPEQSRPLEREMVFYQKTPAKIVFDLIRDAGFTKDDVLFDIGSGLGQVVMLVNLLAGIRTLGVEFDPAFCRYSEKCVSMLSLKNVDFINADARETDYSLGTVFFMYTPFRGKMLQDVLEILRKESLKREIRIISYGPCTPEVTAQDWLHSVYGNNVKITRHAEFISAPHQKGMR